MRHQPLLGAAFKATAVTYKDDLSDASPSLAVVSSGSASPFNAVLAHRNMLPGITSGARHGAEILTAGARGASAQPAELLTAPTALNQGPGAFPTDHQGSASRLERLAAFLARSVKQPLRRLTGAGLVEGNKPAALRAIDGLPRFRRFDKEASGSALGTSVRAVSHTSLSYHSLALSSNTLAAFP